MKQKDEKAKMFSEGKRVTTWYPADVNLDIFKEMERTNQSFNTVVTSRLRLSAWANQKKHEFIVKSIEQLKKLKKDMEDAGIGQHELDIRFGDSYE